MQRKTVTLFFLALMAFAMNTLEACPGCKFTSEKKNGRDMQQVQKGFSYSVLFMLLFPMGLIAGVGRYTYLTIRKIENDRLESFEKKTDSSSS